MHARLEVCLLPRFLSPILFVGICFSQVSSGPVRLTLRDALTQALTNNPSLDVSQTRIDQAEGQRVQARLAPNPRLFLQTEDVRWGGNPPFSYWNSTEDYAYLGQTIETGGKRARRVDLAATDLHGAELQTDLLKRQIQLRVSANYWTAAGAARLRALFEENVKTYDEDVRYVQNRVAEGLMAGVDLMRLQVERDRVRVQAVNAGTDFDRALIELYRAMGKPDFPSATLPDALESQPAVLMPDAEEALKVRPEEKIAQESIARARANARLQRAVAKPDPEAYFGYKRNSRFDTLYAALQIDLPIRNRNQGNIGSAEAEVRAAESNLVVTEANIKADVASAVRTYNSECQIVDRLPGTRAIAQESARLARAAYREGGIDLIRVLDAERNRIELEIEYLQAQVALKQSLLNLQFAGGQELRP